MKKFSKGLLDGLILSLMSIGVFIAAVIMTPMIFMVRHHVDPLFFTLLAFVVLFSVLNGIFEYLRK